MTAVALVAGKLEAGLVEGQLRTIRWDGIEVLRGIACLVRDRDWGTVAPQIEDLAVEAGEGRFAVRYIARFEGPDETRLTIRMTIVGEAGGRLDFSAEGETGTGFSTNRAGFVVLHPIVGVAGRPVTVEHGDGRVVETVFPDLIEPWQPFQDISALTHAPAPGLSATCRLSGDTFEMEDQRNWTDASFKTYVRPLALPWPYEIAAGSGFRQSITLTVTDRRKAASSPPQARPGAEVRLRPAETGFAMPAAGLVISPEDAEETLAQGDRLAALGVQELLFHYDPLAGHGPADLARFAAIAATHAGRTTLELALPCVGDPADEMETIAADLARAGLSPDAVMVSPAVDRQSTPPGSAWPACPPLQTVYAAVRAALPDVRLGGGMLSYFTELNRKRVPAGPLDFIAHATNPIVHAADDLSVMQTLEAIPFVTRSVRAIYGDMPYRIGPSTIAMRQNPYGSRTMDNPLGLALPMANSDPRHATPFGAAFGFGLLAAVLSAEPECLTLAAFAGPRGLLDGKGGLIPLSEVVRLMVSAAGTPVTPLIADGAPVAGLLVAGRARLANLGPVPVTVRQGEGAVTLPPYGLSL